MKKTLLLMGIIAFNGLFYSQFNTGTVSLPTAGMTVKFAVDPTNVTMTLTGDSTSMLGIGFGEAGTGMTAGNDGYIYNTTTNRDYTFSGVGVTPSADASQNWSQVSNTVSGTTRTIVATRTLAGGSEDFAFTNQAGSIAVYYARRAGNTNLGYHGALRDYTTLNFTPTLATNENNLKNQVSVYPNPTKDFVSFANSDKIKSLKVFDINGKLVLSPKSVSDKVDVSKLIQGLYFFEFELLDGSKKFDKIIKE